MECPLWQDYALNTGIPLCAGLCLSITSVVVRPALVVLIMTVMDSLFIGEFKHGTGIYSTGR